MDIHHKARKPTRRLCSSKGPREHTIPQGHREYIGDRNTNTTKELCDVSLEARDGDTKGSHIAGLINIIKMMGP